MAKFKFKNHIWIPHTRLAISVPKGQEVYETEDPRTIEILVANPQVEVVELKQKPEKKEKRVPTPEETVEEAASVEVAASFEVEKGELELEKEVEEPKKEKDKRPTRVRG